MYGIWIYDSVIRPLSPADKSSDYVSQSDTVQCPERVVIECPKTLMSIPYTD